MQHYTELGNKHESASNYVDAAKCYKKSDPMSECKSELNSIGRNDRLQSIIRHDDCQRQVGVVLDVQNLDVD